MCVQAARPRRARAFRADTRRGLGLTCCRGCPVTEEPGPAARDDLEVRALGGRWQVLGSAGQECIEVLEPRDLEEEHISEQVKRPLTPPPPAHKHVNPVGVTLGGMRRRKNHRLAKDNRAKCP